MFNDVRKQHSASAKFRIVKIIPDALIGGIIFEFFENVVRKLYFGVLIVFFKLLSQLIIHKGGGVKWVGLSEIKKIVRSLPEISYRRKLLLEMLKCSCRQISNLLENLWMF